MTVTKIELDQQNRMIRVGFGKNDGNWFARIDMWYVGFRITK